MRAFQQRGEATPPAGAAYIQYLPIFRKHCWNWVYFWGWLAHTLHDLFSQGPELIKNLKQQYSQ